VTQPRAQDDRADDDRRRVADETGARLRQRGVRLGGDETQDEVTRLLDAVEAFETVVMRKGGDLMVDEPVGGRAPSAPDNPAFALPMRRDDESVAAYVARLDEATDRARQVPRS
jgi:hypothetical protein